jgi:hypothetical protein
MALFIDGPVSSMEDLTAQDAQLAEVASTEGVDVTKKLLLAQEEVHIELASLVEDAARVVVTPALRLWHTYRALELVYSDAYFSQLNDRYAAKRDLFAQRARWAREKVMQSGIGLAQSPVRQAETPAVTAVPGAMPDGTYFVTMGWVNSSGQEGACAVPADLTVSGSGLMVTPVNPPIGIAGWNVYAGVAVDRMFRQNANLLAPGQPWLGISGLLTGGAGPSVGQPPDHTTPTEDQQAVVRRLRRG